MKRLLSLTVVCMLLTLALKGQNARLAEEYFRSGEYEKAAMMFGQLYQKSPSSDYYLNRYLDAKLALKDFDGALNTVQDAIAKNPGVPALHVSLGGIYERKGELEKAEKAYRKAIETLPPDQYQITRLATAFMNQTKYDLAIETYKKGGQLINQPTSFAFNLAELYRRKGEQKEMMRQFLLALEHMPQQINTVKNIFSRELKDEELQELQVMIYERIQERGDAGNVYPEMLEWVFIQRKDYKNALRQVKSLDKRNQENGIRVYQLANSASFAGAYDEAIEAYDYILKEKGRQSPYYVAAKQQLLEAKRKQLQSLRSLDSLSMHELEGEYEAFLADYGRNRETAPFMLEYAALEARYLDDMPKAIAILEEVIEMGGVNKYVQANAKLQLGDYYLIEGDIWEATLLYSQVDKAFKEELLGEEARFRNARLSYFAGDFEWAQAQFDILKTATSRLISNDAMDLSVFIMDNLNLDTTALPLSMYAEAELLRFQNKYDASFAKLDSISILFPEHSLEDDVYYLKAKLYREMEEFLLAEENYRIVVEKFIEGIRGDNAMYELAEMYETHMDRKEEAMSLYERLFIEFSSSTFAVEARKRYRALRGDEL